MGTNSITVEQIMRKCDEIRKEQIEKENAHTDGCLKSYISSNLSRCKSGRIFLTTATV